MADLFWSIATSYTLLIIDAVILLAALIVGYFPLLKYLPVIGPYVYPARIIAALMACLMCFLIGFRIADERELAKSLQLQLAAKQIDLTAANAAAQQADEARQQLAEQAKQDEERISEYEASLKARPNANCELTPDDFSDGVRH